MSMARIQPLMPSPAALQGTDDQEAAIRVAGFKCRHSNMGCTCAKQYLNYCVQHLPRNSAIVKPMKIRGAYSVTFFPWHPKKPSQLGFHSWQHRQQPPPLALILDLRLSWVFCNHSSLQLSMLSNRKSSKTLSLISEVPPPSSTTLSTNSHGAKSCKI